METTLGFFLRQLRRTRGLSQAQVAQAAGIGSVTLSRWESGSHQPHKANVEALLRALGATSQERQYALSLLKTPSGPSYDLIVQAKAHPEIGPMPHQGTLLWTLRMRRGLSQEEAARRVGVTERTLRRWENAEVSPSASQIQTLCYVLGARTEEMLALTTDSFALQEEPRGTGRMSLDELKVEVHGLYYNLPQRRDNALKDLNFFLLIAQAWPLALRSAGGREVLSQIYSYYAGALSTQERWSESGYYADRALDLLPDTARPDEIRVIAAIAAARSRVYRGTRLAPQRGIEMLHHWSDANPNPVYQGWILSDLAEYLSLSGDAQGGVSQAQRARELSTDCENINDLNLRELDEAQALIWAGKPAHALPLVERNKYWLPEESLLVEIEAFLSMRDPGQAQERFDELWELIERRGMQNFLPQIQRLEARLRQGL